MPDVRDPLRCVGGQLSGIPDVRRLLGEPWHLQAACKDESNPKTFFPEAPPFKSTPSSGSQLLPLLYCATCPVRRECLRSALEPLRFNVRDDDQLTAPRVFGCWGGTHEGDRVKVQHLPVEERLEVPERSFPGRLQARIDAYQRERARPRTVENQPEPRRRPLRKTDRRIDELLSKRQGGG